MPIKKQNDEANSLTIYTATGTISLSELLDVAKTFKTDPPYSKVIWDFSEANPDDSFNSPDIDKLAYLVKSTLGVRHGSKTAYVGKSDAVFGLLRMYSTHLQIKEIAHEIDVFRSLDEAHQWLE